MYKNVCLLGKGLCLCVNLFASSIYCTGFYTECFGKKTKFFFFFLQKFCSPCNTASCSFSLSTVSLQIWLFVRGEVMSKQKQVLT